MERTTLSLFSLLVLSVGTAQADPLLYYKIIPHATGSSCAAALDTLVSSQLYNGTSSGGVPTVSDTSLNYAVESMTEATQLCAQISGIAVPIAAQGSTDAANYALGAHPWTRSDAPVINPDDARCASNASVADDGTAQAATSYYTYLELNGVCLSSADYNSPPPDPTAQ